MDPQSLLGWARPPRVATPAWSSPTARAIQGRRAGRRSAVAPYRRQTSSSPAVRYPSTSPPGAAGTGRVGDENTPPAAGPSNINASTSIGMWNYLGSTPPEEAMRTPLQDITNNRTLATVQEEPDNGPGGTGETMGTEDEDGTSGKHPNLLPLLDNPADLRKRMWAGSPTAELSTKGHNKRIRAAFPGRSLRYELGDGMAVNPWAPASQNSITNDLAFENTSPVATSTPILHPAPPPHHASKMTLPIALPDDTFFLDNVNASGRPPTPHHMNDSTFVARLKRSAREDRSCENSISLNDLLLSPATLPRPPRDLNGLPTQKEVGSSRLPLSSPLPPSSPLPWSSPLPSSLLSHPPSPHPHDRHISERDVHRLLSDNRMRLNAILANPEPSGMEAPPATQLPRSRKSPQSINTRDAPRTRDMRPESGRTGGPETFRFGTAISKVPERARTVYAPHPMTRAAQHLQAQIEARLEAADARKPLGSVQREAPGRVLATREDSSSPVPSRGGRSATPRHSQSGMELDEPSELHGTSGGRALRPSPLTEWLRKQPPSDERDEDGSDGPDMRRIPLNECGPNGSPDPNADLTAPHIALPTVLTAVAPNIDKPMLAPTRMTYRVYRDDPEAIIRGVKKAWIEAVWSDPTGSVVLVEVFNFQYTDNVQTNRVVVETLKRFVFVITGEDQVHIVPPELDETTRRGARDAPRVFAIRGLTPSGEEALLSRFPWSFRAISFFVYKREVGPDTWLFSLEGFLDENTQAITSAVRGTLEEPEQWQRLVDLTRGNPDFRGLAGTERANKVLDSIVVKTWRLSNGNIVTNVFILPPTRDIPKWRQWADDLRAKRYGNFINGTGTVRRVSNCLGCNSVEHPTHLCPFHDLPGWNGPRAGTGTYSTLLPPPPPPMMPVHRRQEDRRQPNQRGERPRGVVTPRRKGGRGGYRN